MGRPVRPRAAAARALLLGAAAAPTSARAWWPFEGDDSQEKQGDDDDGGTGGLPPGMEFAFGGVPVIHVESHFGFDPFEDIHRNMGRLVEKSSKDSQMLLPPDGDPSSPGGPGSPFEVQLGSILELFGGLHAGQFGRAEGSFEVTDDDPSRFRISALLPGYKLDSEGNDDDVQADESRLSVRAIGRRSLVVSGNQPTGPLIRTWQRSFSLPKGSNIDEVAVTYSAATGNLTVDVPRRNATEGDEEEEEEPEDELDMAGLPPALRAMHAGLPGLVSQMKAGRPQGSGGGGFLMPTGAMPIGDIFGQAFGMLETMHPRFHAPPGAEQPLPEDAEVSLVGCFAESQLAKVELKYYGEANAASFNAMYWHARSDHVNYFAMSRHEVPMGHAFTAKGFVHEDEKPQWGTYDGCGSRCEDDDDRWCGCANEDSRGLGNANCPTEGEKRFAVYKIGNTPPSADANASAEQPEEEDAGPPVSAQGRPYWQLAEAKDSKEASIEIVVPKGQVAKANGRDVLLYSEGDAAPVARGSDEGGGGADDDTAQATTTTPPVAPSVGKMRLPVGVSPEDCEYDPARKTEDGGQVLKCKLKTNVVKKLPIKVVDEL